ncbi:hypothetical protein AB0H71_13880 [Nocardia sp. NPDC050697]|uniref:hypothetical protein n=1 Tax=Nocardia sp. NPDC050697 TaxID=3155158 RepID=UPI0033D95AE3
MDTPPCGPCKEARKAREAWDVEHARRVAEGQARDRRRKAEVRRAAIESCPLHCEDGYLDGALCAHEPPPSRPSLRQLFERDQAAKAAFTEEAAS